MREESGEDLDRRAAASMRTFDPYAWLSPEERSQIPLTSPLVSQNRALLEAIEAELHRVARRKMGEAAKARFSKLERYAPQKAQSERIASAEVLSPKQDYL